jgi:predicted nuclease of predicted toxin-antitoxin system
LRFVVDAQLPPALATHLIAAGHQAEHVNAIGHEAATDAEIWSYAIEADAVIVTKDEDFAALSNREPEGAQVIWVRLGNATNRALWAALEPLLPEIIEALEAGERLIEIA